MVRTATTATVWAVIAALFGLMTYEVVTLAVGVVALTLAVVSLIQGQDTRRDLRALVEKQNRRAGRLIEGLEDDVASGD